MITGEVRPKEIVKSIVEQERDDESLLEPSIGSEEPSRIERNASYVSKKSINRFAKEQENRRETSNLSISDDGASIIFKT